MGRVNTEQRKEKYFFPLRRKHGNITKVYEDIIPNCGFDRINY